MSNFLRQTWLERLRFTNNWDDTSPPGGQNVSLGDDRIREDKVNVNERYFGVDGDGPMDDSGTRDIDTDPMEIFPGVIDTVSLDIGAGGTSAVARAVSFFDSVSINADFTHPGADGTVFVNITGLQIIIPGTVLQATGLEHTNGTAAGSTDFAIILRAKLLISLASGGSTSFGIFRIRNSTDGANVGEETRSEHTQASINTTGNNTREWVQLYGVDTARTAATTYDIQLSQNNAAGRPTIEAGTAGGICDFHAMVIKR